MVQLEIDDNKPKWLFPDEIQKPILAIFTGYLDYKTVSNTIPVLVFSTELGEKTYLSLWKTDTKLAVKEYGKDTDKWVTKSFYIQTNSGGKFLLKPIEEKLKD